jgi:hypothetical protein
MPSIADVAAMICINASVRSRVPRGGAQQLRDFFLELDQALGTIRPRLRPLRAALEFGDLLVPRIRRRRHRATLPRRRPELPVHPLRPPAGQVRRVQPLTPQQRRHGTLLVGAGVRLEQHPQLLGGREPAPARLR